MKDVGSLPVVILGCTGVGFKALGIFNRNGHEVYGFLGEKPDGGLLSSQDGWEVLGALSEANVAKWMALDSRIVFFVAMDFHKGEAYRSLLGDRLINAIDIRAVISGSFPLVRGVLVDTGAYLGQGVSLRSGVVIGAYACLDVGRICGRGRTDWCDERDRSAGIYRFSHACGSSGVYCAKIAYREASAYSAGCGGF